MTTKQTGIEVIVQRETRRSGVVGLEKFSCEPDSLVSDIVDTLEWDALAAFVYDSDGELLEVPLDSAFGTLAGDAQELKLRLRVKSHLE
jgi:hypothetical protein